VPKRRRAESEAETRRERVDPMLRAAGWEVVDHDPNRTPESYDHQAVREYPTDSGPSDYALFVAGRILGIVEAKKITLGPQNVLTQAERYSRGATTNPLAFGDHHVPFLYSTNGKIIWHHDIRHALNRSRKIRQFHSPAGLTERLESDFDEASARLLTRPNNQEFIRDYQKDANLAIEKAMVDRKRAMLIAMATGTGKTYTMVNQVYRLMKSGTAKRILFMVDRRALAAQAVRAFASFEAEPGLKFNKIYEVYSQRFRREDFDDDEKYDPMVLPESYLVSPTSGHAFVYVCTIQRMMVNLFGRGSVFGKEEIEDDADRLEIPNHAFDAIIADECHRGYTAQELSAWRDTLDHFDAIKIGLTATPATHTVTYFGKPVFRYDYSRAVREGYLVDYDPVHIRSDVRVNGVFLNEGEHVGVVDTETGEEQLDLLEDERKFGADEVEAKVTAPESNRRILQEIKKYADEHERETGRFPKTLIFAANDIPHTSHADSLVDIARDVFGQGDSFVKKITGTVDRPLQYIREFRNRPQPSIVVTVDMLSTGVDIPDLEFIVFLRQVKSRILFEQMLGRGTRKGEKYPDKSHFVVFDCFDGTMLGYFANATGITADPPRPERRTIVEVIEDIWRNVDRDYNIRCLVRRLQRIDKDMSAEARQRFAEFISDGDLARYAREVPARLRDDFTGEMALLRNAAFQELLINYPRAKRTFVVAYEAEDTVTSSRVVKGSDGKDYRPEDYISAFMDFVRDNPEHVEAIGILLDHPRDWGREALSELRSKLKAAPQRFTEENLRKAHEIHYRKALVDIISMVKHAAREDEGLYTADERVRRAFEKVTEGKAFTDDQRQWLDRIRYHMIENLSIEREDFDVLPVFSRAGGWGRADKVFDGRLDELVRRFNEAVAA